MGFGMAGWCGVASFRLWIFKIRNLRFGVKVALPVEFQAFSSQFRAPKKYFWTLEDGHSIRHQSIPLLKVFGQIANMGNRGHDAKQASIGM